MEEGVVQAGEVVVQEDVGAFQRLSLPHDFSSIVTGQELNDDWGRSIFMLGEVMGGSDFDFRDVNVELVVGECDEVSFHGG